MGLVPIAAVLLTSSGAQGSRARDLAGILLPRPPECGGDGVRHHTQLPAPFTKGGKKTKQNKKNAENTRPSGRSGLRAKSGFWELPGPQSQHGAARLEAAAGWPPRSDQLSRDWDGCREIGLVIARVERLEEAGKLSRDRGGYGTINESGGESSS